jgi:hypothetical protein
VCTYSGARVGELTQLRVLEQRVCGPCPRITPDEGTVKTGKARTNTSPFSRDGPCGISRNARTMGIPMKPDADSDLKPDSVPI